MAAVGGGAVQHPDIVHGIAAGGTVVQTPIVPHHEITQPPFMTINIAFLDLIIEELVQQRLSFLVVHAVNGNRKARRDIE